MQELAQITKKRI